LQHFAAFLRLDESTLANSLESNLSWSDCSISSTANGSTINITSCRYSCRPPTGRWTVESERQSLPLPDGACVAIGGSWRFAQIKTETVKTNLAAPTSTPAVSEHILGEDLNNASSRTSTLKLPPSLVVRPGQLVVVCGPPGAGTSALLLSLFGELTPTLSAHQSHSANGSNDNSKNRNSSGGNNESISSIGENSCGRRTLNETTNICYVPQDGFVFNGTLKDNILFFAHKHGGPSSCTISGIDDSHSAHAEHTQLTASDQAAYEAALINAALDADLPSLPDGEYTLVGSNGWQLSRSQKQRVALARALFGARPGAPRQRRQPTPPSTAPEADVGGAAKTTTAAPLSNALQSALAGAWSNAAFTGSSRDSNSCNRNGNGISRNGSSPSKQLRFNRRLPAMAPLIEVDERPSDLTDSLRGSLSIDESGDRDVTNRESAMEVIGNSAPLDTAMILLDDPLSVMDDDVAQRLWQKAIQSLIKRPLDEVETDADSTPSLIPRQSTTTTEGICAVVLATSRLDLVMADAARVHEVLISSLFLSKNERFALMYIISAYFLVYLSFVNLSFVPGMGNEPWRNCGARLTFGACEVKPFFSAIARQ